jgi:chaperonin GroEL
MKVCIVKAPFHGQRRNLAMIDLQTIVGGKIFTGEDIKTITVEDFGKVEKVIVTADNTTLYKGKGNEAGIKKLQETLKLQIEETKDKREKTFFEERLAKLSKGIGTIYVGGFTTVEMEEKIDRVEDALNATRASVDEGFIAGEGVSFLRASKLLEDFNSGSREQNIGVGIIREALKAPFKQILKNAGFEEEIERMLAEVQKDVYGFGVDLENGDRINLFERGIIDPLKVARVALENASSMAGTFLTIEAIVLNDETLF